MQQVDCMAPLQHACAPLSLWNAVLLLLLFLAQVLDFTAETVKGEGLA